MNKTTRQKLIDITFEEIYSYGYQGASLADILKKSNVHKGSMYHYFKNKKEMCLVAIAEKMDERFFEKYGEILQLQSGFLKELIEGFKDTSQKDFQRGCPIANIVQEMSNIDEDFNKLMKQVYSKFRGYIKKILDKAIETNEIKNCNSSQLALYITAILEGAILATKASGNIKDYSDTILLLEEYLNSLKNK